MTNFSIGSDLIDMDSKRTPKILSIGLVNMNTEDVQKSFSTQDVSMETRSEDNINTSGKIILNFNFFVCCE